MLRLLKQMEKAADNLHGVRGKVCEKQGRAGAPVNDERAAESKRAEVRVLIVDDLTSTLHRSEKCIVVAGFCPGGQKLFGKPFTVQEPGRKLSGVCCRGGSTCR